MIKMSKKRVASLLIVTGLVLGIVSASLWYTRLYWTKERRFWAAIENGLRTSSVVKEVITDNPNGESKINTRLTFTPLAYTETKTETHQRIDTQTSSDVVTRTLTTPKDAYVRYDSIRSNEKKPDGSSFDFSPINGVWAKRDSSDYSENDLKDRLSGAYIQTIPFANLDEATAQEMVGKLRATGAYEVDYQSAAEDHQNNLTVYNATLNARAYVSVLQEIYQKIGFGESSNLDPTQYDDSSSLKIQIAIDGANIVRKVAYPQSGNNGPSFESYRDYGAQVVVNPATKSAINFSELQNRLTKLQK